MDTIPDGVSKLLAYKLNTFAVFGTAAAAPSAAAAPLAAAVAAAPLAAAVAAAEEEEEDEEDEEDEEEDDEDEDDDDEDADEGEDDVEEAEGILLQPARAPFGRPLRRQLLRAQQVDVAGPGGKEVQADVVSLSIIAPRDG